MLNTESALRHAQIYRFLTEVFLYPQEDWTQDLSEFAALADGLAPRLAELPERGLDELQSAYRHTFGMTGSLCYETEYGLPHEFRQSQELADIAGFYRAFGFEIGGAVHERPDHIASELEFMYVLALKQAYALERGLTEQADVCAEAQKNFLRDHLARWINLFAERLAQNNDDETYRTLAQFAATFVRRDAEARGLQIEPRRLIEVLPTPPGPDMSSCNDCPVDEFEMQGE